ncbi:hypothetical protein AC579_7829 [Pseudocercospora musae]|uniref:Uncharacterized protein n=1 Tax=Pseudocercospora musae TaxID=113226 RepID=A0A139I4L4_9PEZI|nr:hypothetical protein AC579_7829 [Pseudocercospora musae]
MSDSQSQSKESRAQAFVRGAGEVQDPEHKLWAPARWVVQMVQYLIAIIMINGYLHLPFDAKEAWHVCDDCCCVISVPADTVLWVYSTEKKAILSDPSMSDQRRRAEKKAEQGCGHHLFAEEWTLKPKFKRGEVQTTCKMRKKRR